MEKSTSIITCDPLDVSAETLSSVFSYVLATFLVSGQSKASLYDDLGMGLNNHRSFSRKVQYSFETPLTGMWLAN